MGARGSPAEVSPAVRARVMSPGPAGLVDHAGLVDPEGPVVSGEDVLPVLPALRGLLAAGGLQRGQVVATEGGGLLFLALAAGARGAAVEVGLDPGQLLVVAQPGQGWPQVVASLLDGCDVVLLQPPARPAAQL